METTNYTRQLNHLTQQYNAMIRTLEQAYEHDCAHTDWATELMASSKLKRQYNQRYESLSKEYLSQRSHLLTSWKTEHPQWARRRTFWSWLFFIGIFCMMGACMSQIPEEDNYQSASVMSNPGETTYWNAENIPIPYLQNATQYVSNPDSVLTQGAVDKINVTLKRLEDEMDIQTLVVVVNHIENDDPFRMAQDIGNKYGVGKDDKGLVIIVGYEDHSINISPGKKLEADLTDAECHRLEQQYVVPAMKVQMPDSGMVYLMDGIVATLQKKSLPPMSQFSDNDDLMDEDELGVIGLCSLLFLLWICFYLWLNRKYQWMPLIGTVMLLPNPFRERTNFYIDNGGGNFFGGGGSFGGGGGFSGGSFGGGSFGGGGATSRW